MANPAEAGLVVVALTITGSHIANIAYANQLTNTFQPPAANHAYTALQGRGYYGGLQ